VYGKNLGTAADGPEWRRHRAVAKPAFNEVGQYSAAVLVKPLIFISG
jgi:hypothetical protein